MIVEFSGDCHVVGWPGLEKLSDCWEILVQVDTRLSGSDQTNTSSQLLLRHCVSPGSWLDVRRRVYDDTCHHHHSWPGLVFSFSTCTRPNLSQRKICRVTCYASTCNYHIIRIKIHIVLMSGQILL